MNIGDRKSLAYALRKAGHAADMNDQQYWLRKAADVLHAEPPPPVVVLLEPAQVPGEQCSIFGCKALPYAVVDTVTYCEPHGQRRLNG